MARAQPPLIPRNVFFGNADRTSVQISPDGSRLAWLAPLDGVLNVWVAPRDDPQAARPVTRDTGRGIRNYFWTFNNTHLLYLQDKDGDENWRLYAVEPGSKDVRDLTPFEGAQAQVLEVSPKHPQEIVIGLNNRDPQWHDVYRVNIVTGAMVSLLQHNRFLGFVVDDELRVRQAARMTADGGMDLYLPSNDKPDESDEDWRLWSTIPAEDMLPFSIVGFDKPNQCLLVRDSRGRDTAALVELDLETGTTRVLAADPKADAADVVRHPTEKHVQAAAFVYERKEWQILDAGFEQDLERLRTVCRGDIEIPSRSLDDRYWVVTYVVDDGPARFYLYDRSEGPVGYLFTNRAALEDKPLARMHSAVITSRDGLSLVVYWTLPVGTDEKSDGVPREPVPMVMIPHGGPWHRDSWGYSPWHQWLANRGYAVLSVNFRASTGFGKAFANAGDREWGGKIMDDQQDAVRWAIGKGIADPARVGVFGGSFGGYSTLAGLTLTPEVFACGVDLVGPSSLVTLLESVPPYWKPSLELFTTRVGDHRTPDGRALLERHSPLTRVDRICRPLLIGQGANDPRVKQAESDQIVDAMEAKGIPVTYALYPDEGHGFARPENNLSFNAIAEAFLAEHLGGRCEPIGSDFAGSSLTVPVGAGEVPGLEEALAETGLRGQAVD